MRRRTWCSDTTTVDKTTTGAHTITPVCVAYEFSRRLSLPQCNNKIVHTHKYLIHFVSTIVVIACLE